MAAARDRALTIVISTEQLALLKRLDFPGSAEVLATARKTTEGIEIHGSHAHFDELVGWVAGEANHTRSPARERLLSDVFENLEAALASR